MAPRPRDWKQTSWYASQAHCQRLAELIGWTYYAEHYWQTNGRTISHGDLSQKRLEHWQSYDQELEWNFTPAFELGWLVRQLPPRHDDHPFRLVHDGAGWNAGYDDGPQVTASGAEDALCQLLIDLVEQGTITVSAE